MRRVGIICLFFIYFSCVNAAYSWFQSGQEAYILLSGKDFNNCGYLFETNDGLLFNHPMNIATSGNKFLLADTRNNRILIWNSIPNHNDSPDLVLGQKNFIENTPGDSLSQLDWPVSVSTDGEKVVVADTFNNRILIWKTFPVQNAQPADIVIDFKNFENEKERIEWPWDVWTDGEKLIATSTSLGYVLIWNTFPQNNNQPADIILKAKNPIDGTNRFGTPRSIGTDGRTYLAIGDHNARESNQQGTFFWNSFPREDNQPYDYFMANPVDNMQMMWGGIKTPNGKFVMLASPGLAIWNSYPLTPRVPDLVIGKPSPGPNPEDWKCDENGYSFDDGDGSDIVVTSSGKIFISLYNGNKIVVYNSLPQNSSQCPDYVIGAPDIDTNTLVTHNIITNPIPATNGRSLFVTSDFDNKLYIWKTIPIFSGTPPDDILVLNEPVWDNAIYGNNFVAAGKDAVLIWKRLPLEHNMPDIIFKGRIGSVVFKNISGIAIDDRYLYIADSDNKKIYVWNKFPEQNSEPVYTISLEDVGRISSDGTYLVVSKYNGGSEGGVYIFKVDQLSSEAEPIKFINKSEGVNFEFPTAIVSEGHLFISDLYNRVVTWENIEDAIEGKGPDAIIGNTNHVPKIGKNTLFWPQGMSFYKNILWVGEFKFSGRILGFKFDINPINAFPEEFVNPIKYQPNLPLPEPSHEIINIPPNSETKLQPQLKIPNEFVNRKATLFLFVYVPELDSWIEFPKKEKTLGNKMIFDNLEATLDFSEIHSLIFDVWFGFSVDGEIYFNNYEVIVSE